MIIIRTIFTFLFNTCITQFPQVKIVSNYITKTLIKAILALSIDIELIQCFLAIKTF
jgi:hypothetical protein